MLRLIVYEDNEKLRQALELMFADGDEVHLCAAFPDCSSVAEDVLTLTPDVVLMDIDMPGVNGIEGVRRIKEVAPHVRVVMHTVFDEDSKIFNALAAGADGYLLKSVSPVQLYSAVGDVAGGGSPMSPGVARKVLDSFRQKEESKSADIVPLSEREREILQQLTFGHTYKRIAAECGISIDTTRTHIKNIYTKLHVNCGTEAVVKALRLRLVG
jgi:DNA-binding NarL/FixJ family response regulator